MTDYCKREFSDGGKIESIWRLGSITVILAIALYWDESLVGIIAALTLVWCLVLAGMGTSMCFILGVVKVLTYAYIAYGAKYYGKIMLNSLYYFSMNLL